VAYLDASNVAQRFARCADHLGRDESASRQLKRSESRQLAGKHKGGSGKGHLGGRANASTSWYRVTPWSTSRRPAYPDVPRVVETILGQGWFKHYTNVGKNRQTSRRQEAEELASLVELPQLPCDGTPL
jgi:hypothetical protein